MRKRTSIGGFWGLIALAMPQALHAYSANKVWFDSLDDGRYRVGAQYTVPALKEFREAHAIFTRKKEAETFYWHLVRGGDFSVNGPAQMRYSPIKKAPNPW